MPEPGREKLQRGNDGKPIGTRHSRSPSPDHDRGRKLQVAPLHAAAAAAPAAQSSLSPMRQHFPAPHSGPERELSTMRAHSPLADSGRVQLSAMQNASASHGTPSSSRRPTVQGVKRKLAEQLYSHVTREESVSSIMKTGLDPSRGGTGGASDAIGSEKFKEQSANYVHLGLDSKALPGKPRASESYASFYEHSGIESRTLNVGLPQGAELVPDPDDKRGGRYKTKSAISPGHIVPHSLKTAFRAPGAIGADYAPAEFVKRVTAADSNRSIKQLTEDIRRAVYNTEDTIFPDA